ncbi:hypothetical protein ASPWEDRAFT_362912 [Aspergillus wentii DTO 134E9]|uniref:Uncharacterized protein n=1 Tax=Aspergillus wentii DTO 134E9 TaxID=1073089 RepID=A0A1L9RWA8_ASPWE|nr:uncharacterized protein ASPWEDRAFT_362912 [Aspergillus wentii DTO 134E9]OJJ39230.1 hypothetical protein ASPWEDRAFT_362912 [Aspergillus wentii DTO 134E9]
MVNSASPGQAGDIKHDDTTVPPVSSGQENVSAVKDSGDGSTTTPAPVEQKQQNRNEADDDEDEDSDFDELDDVLDDFSKPKPSATPSQQEQPQQQPQSADMPEDFDEDAFMKQLEQDMASMMGGAGAGSAPELGTKDQEGFEDTINQGADAFTKHLEESGIPPGDFLKELLADVMAGGDGGAGGAADAATQSGPGSSAAGGSEGGAVPESFNDAIHRTMNRMQESGDKATAAAEQDDSADDMIAQLLKAVEAGGESGDGDLTKMFMGMMEQLSTKEMLYDPIKELHGKFGPWLEKNKGKVSEEEMAKYQKQALVVSQMVTKFEEPGYSDEDPKCREYVWARMQEVCFSILNFTQY